MTTPPETIHTLRQRSAAILADAGIETAMLDARVLLSHVLGMSPTELLIADGDPVSPDAARSYVSLIEQRAIGLPLAYLTGSREFMGLTFQTTPSVLVPRPDTEPLVEWGLAWLEHHPAVTVADIGTGSGVIAISVAYHAPDTWSGRVIATDVSPEALAIAERNANTLLTPSRRGQLDLRLGDLTAPLDAPVDLLLTNLPYLTPAQMRGNLDLRHEPALALDGGEDGLDLVRRVIADLPRVLAPVGAVGFEIDPSQASDVAVLLSRQLPHHTVTTVRDLAGDARHIVALLPDS